VASLSLTLQSTTFAGQQSLLIWQRQDGDGTGALDFNLWFVQGTDQQDAGIEVRASSSQQSGSVQVVLPKVGSYAVMAVDDSGNTLGTSNNVLAIASPSASATSSESATSSASATASASTSTSPKATSTSSTQRHSKAPVIVGSIIASLVVLAIIAALLMFLNRRRRLDNSQTKRWTFHKHMMVQPYQQPTVQSSSSSIYSTSTFPEDPEQGLRALQPVPSAQLSTLDSKPRLPDPVLYPTRVAGLMERRPTIRKLDLDSSHLPRSPMGPRPPIIHPASLTPSTTILRSGRPMSPIPRSPSPRTHRQRAIADQIEILRLQMLEVERDGVKDHIGMSEMSDKLSWLREQQEGSWALGLTDVTPLGYDRYMT